MAATTGIRPSGLISTPYPAGSITSPFFRPPSSCNELTYSTSFTDQLWLGYQDNCFPSNYYNVYAASSAQAYYSPALCPDGWTSYPWQDTDSGAPSATGETIMDCCQSGVTPVSLGFCQGVATPTTTAQIETSGEFSFVTTITGPTSILANMIQIRYQSSDCSVLGLCTSSTSSSSSSTSTSTSSTTSKSASASTSTPAPAAKKGGLSTGAKAAIGVVIPVVVLAALIIAFLLVRRRKQKQKTPTETGPMADPNGSYMGAPPMGMAPQQQAQFYQGQPGVHQPQYQGYPPPEQQQQHLDKGMVVGGGPVLSNYTGEHPTDATKHFSAQSTGSTAYSPAPQYMPQHPSPAPIYEAPGEDHISPVATTDSPSQFKAQPADEFYAPHAPSAPTGQGEAEEEAAIKRELEQVKQERK